MTISLIGTPPGIIGNISNKRLLHFFLFGGGGAGAGNGGFAGGNGAALAFSAYLEKEDVLYMYNGTGGTAGGTSNAAIGGGGGGASFIYADVRKTRLGSNPNGYGVNSNLLLAAAGGGGGGGTETNAYGGNAGLVNTSTGATLNASSGGGTNPGTGGTATGPGLGGIYDAAGLGDPLYYLSADNGSDIPLGEADTSGAGGKGYVNGTINSGGGNTGDDEANVVGSSSVDHGHGRDGYQQGGAGGGGGYYGGGGSSFDGGGSAVAGGGGGSSFMLNALQYCGGHDILSLTAGGGFDETDVNGFNLTSLSSIPTNVGNGGAGASSGVAGSNGQGGYIVILDTNGNIAAQTTGATSGWKYTVV